MASFIGSLLIRLTRLVQDNEPLTANSSSSATTGGASSKRPSHFLVHHTQEQCDVEIAALIREGKATEADFFVCIVGAPMPRNREEMMQ